MLTKTTNNHDVLDLMLERASTLEWRPHFGAYRATHNDLVIQLIPQTTATGCVIISSLGDPATRKEYYSATYPNTVINAIVAIARPIADAWLLEQLRAAPEPEPEHEPEHEPALRMARLRQLALDLALYIEKSCVGREQELALTKLEESVFWAHAAITREPEPSAAPSLSCAGEDAAPRRYDIYQHEETGEMSVLPWDEKPTDVKLMWISSTPMLRTLASGKAWTAAWAALGQHGGK